MSDDEIIEILGIELLRELRAICWFCDAGGDGKMALIGSDRRKWYDPGGDHAPLVETGCVKLYQKTYCETIKRHRPAVGILHQGRRVLLRARAVGIDLSSAEEDEYV